MGRTVAFTNRRVLEGQHRRACARDKVCRRAPIHLHAKIEPFEILRVDLRAAYHVRVIAVRRQRRKICGRNRSCSHTVKIRKGAVAREVPFILRIKQVIEPRAIVVPQALLKNTRAMGCQELAFRMEGPGQ